MSKGKRHERECAGIYEDAGYKTFRPQESQWGETDIFGLFDLIAVPPCGSRSRACLVQVKTNRRQGVLKWCENALRFRSRAIRPEYATKYDHEGWQLAIPTPDGPMDVLDERDYDQRIGEPMRGYLAERLEQIPKTMVGP